MLKVKVKTPLIVQGVPKTTKAPWLKKSTRKWEVFYDFHATIDEVDWIIPRGYVFDGASIPRFLWIFWTPTNEESWEASCVHDYFYSHATDQVTKKFADDVFRQMLINAGASKMKVFLFFHAVRLFGKGQW